MAAEAVGANSATSSGGEASNAHANAYDVPRLVEELKSEGIIILENVLSPEACDHYIERLEAQLEERIANGHYCGNETNQVLDNYFMTDHGLLELIYQPVTDQIMRAMIDDDYVLISPSARNRRLLPNRRFGRKTSGIGWHTDSRFIQGGQGLRPSLCYMSILCLDPFEKENGATHYIPRSHLRYERPADRDAALAFEYMLAPKGALVVFDTALWHRVGEPSESSRWGVFNTYGPWFMKPYHRFGEMFTREEMASFPPIIRQLLHDDSTPPRDHNESMITLRRVRERVEGGAGPN